MHQRAGDIRGQILPSGIGDDRHLLDVAPMPDAEGEVVPRRVPVPAVERRKVDQETDLAVTGDDRLDAGDVFDEVGGGQFADHLHPDDIVRGPGEQNDHRLLASSTAKLARPCLKS